MTFKQSGFPTHSGTSGHKSALKAHIPGHKPKMSHESAHGQLGDAKADFKSDKDAYEKIMKPKTMDKLQGEGFDPNEAKQMQEDGAMTGDGPGKFLKKIFGKEAKEGRAERKAARKEARPKRRAAKKVTKAENRKIKQDSKTAKVKSKLASRQKKAETNINEKKAAMSTNEQIVEGRKEKGGKGKGVNKLNKFLYGKSGTLDEGLHNLNEYQKFGTGKTIKKYKGDDHDATKKKNKLNSKQNQNTTLGAKSGVASESKTSKLSLKKQIALDKKSITKGNDNIMESMKQQFPDTYGKSKKTKAEEKATAERKRQNDPIWKASKKIHKTPKIGGSYDKYFG